MHLWNLRNTNGGFTNWRLAQLQRYFRWSRTLVYSCGGFRKFRWKCTFYAIHNHGYYQPPLMSPTLIASSSLTLSLQLVRELLHSPLEVLQHAGDWLNVLPSPVLGLHLYSKEFRLCLRYWLGLALLQFPLLALNV